MTVWHCSEYTGISKLLAGGAKPSIAAVKPWPFTSEKTSTVIFAFFKQYLDQKTKYSMWF